MNARLLQFLCWGFTVGFAGLAAAIEVHWQPARPQVTDSIQVEFLGCSQGGVMHWGVNAKGNQWEAALPVYQPIGSAMDGVATRTPLDGPDENGNYRVILGPFLDPGQSVSSVDFAIQWADGSWDNHDGQDYHLLISSGRISVSPENPTLNQGLTITVHRSRPGGFLHWGVNAEHGGWQAPHEVYWPTGSVLYSDLNSVDTPLPDPDDHGNSVLLLGPFQAGPQMVKSLHLAVHWGEEWDTDSGRNFNVNIARETRSDAPRVTILEPVDDSNISGRLSTRLEVTGAETAALWLNGSLFAELNGPPFEHDGTITNLDHGSYTLVARVEREGLVDMDQVILWHRPVYGKKSFAGEIPLGATVNDDGTVTFALHAPGKQFVSLIGDFNGWDPDQEVMNVTTDGTWWLRRPLSPGTYAYQYLVEGKDRLADPYSHDVEWKNEDKRETYHPRLAQSILQVGQPLFPWHDAGFARPPLENLLIYEFYIEDLCPGKGFQGVIDKLDYIKSLGANAIEPLPWHEFTGDTSWGYNPSFHFAPESSYGSPEDLKRMIDEAHQRGIAVICDLVLNHMDKFSPLFQLYGEDYDASPYFYRFTGENWGFPDLEQDSPAFKQYVADVIQFWISDYHVDGFRYDATRWVGWQGYNDWGASWFAYAAKSVDTNSYQIAEHLPPDPELIQQTEMDTGWDSNFRWRLRDMLVNGQLDSENLSQILDGRPSGFQNSFQRVAYIESHDEERILRDLLKAGYSFDEALRRSLSAAALTLTAPGVTMIYSGEETGEFKPRRVGPNLTDWTHLEMNVFKDLHAGLARLGRLRTSHPALRLDNLEIVRNDPATNLAIVQRLAPEGAVWVAVNFGRTDQSLSVELPRPGSWSDVLTQTPMDSVPGQSLSLNLLPGETKVFQCLEKPGTNFPVVGKK